MAKKKTPPAGNEAKSRPPVQVAQALAKDAPVPSRPPVSIQMPKPVRFFSVKKAKPPSQEPAPAPSLDAAGSAPHRASAPSPKPSVQEEPVFEPMPKPAAGPEAGLPEPEGLSDDEKQILLKPYLQPADHEKVLEAALFMSGQSLASADLAKLLGIAAVGHVNELLEGLAESYNSRHSALEIVQEENSKWAMRVRAHLAPSVRQFAGEAEISRHALRTLAYISKNSGITKRTLFKRLGSTIYEDCAELLEKGFISAAPAGRTMSLRTTEKFKQYFSRE